MQTQGKVSNNSLRIATGLPGFMPNQMFWRVFGETVSSYKYNLVNQADFEPYKREIQEKYTPSIIGIVCFTPYELDEAPTMGEKLLEAMFGKNGGEALTSLMRMGGYRQDIWKIVDIDNEARSMDVCLMLSLNF
ncbi:hypothetical protein FWH09_02290 [Candidatus Saccharibacteria bacterium]|nr:hypothetical protein [Candidatus Saccharibacteria bacterium]